MKIKSEPTEVDIKGISLIDFFDSEFIKIMKKHLPDFNFLIFGMYTLDDKCKPEDRIILSQKVAEDFEENIISINAEKSEILEKITKVMEEYFKDKWFYENYL